MSKDQSILKSVAAPSSSHFWENKYQTLSTGWDLGLIAPPLKSYIDTLENKDIAILIPGCGNAYEAEYLLQHDFTNVTIIDFAPTLVQQLQNKFANHKNINVVLGNFFEHTGTYDLIIEQTFFCALPPNMRQRYVWKMHQLLSSEGILAGLLFNRIFESGPPFGGSLRDYKKLFQKSFEFKRFALSENSISNRANTELFFEFQKCDFCHVHIFNFANRKENNSKKVNIGNLLNKSGIENVSINTDNTEILICSTKEMKQNVLENFLSTAFTALTSETKKL